jgi:guanylate kinase
MAGKLIIFSAPSGSGKSTIINYLLTQNLNLAFSISATRMFCIKEQVLNVM